MEDLTSALIAVACLCLAAAAAGAVVGKKFTGPQRLVAQILALVLMAGYFQVLWNRPILTNILPSSSLIVTGNWLPMWGSFFLGTYICTRSIDIKRRRWMSTVTVLFIAYSASAPMFGRAPSCTGQLTSRELQYQTTPYTCSPACAASLLRLHGIEASEGQLAELCLTRRGTHWMGVYRGLMLMTAGTEWTVAVQELDNSFVEKLHVPCILSLNIDTQQFGPTGDHGFDEDVGHSVVFLKKSRRDSITVFDPSPDFGIENWTPETTSCISSGVAISLVPRNKNNTRTAAVDRRISKVLSQRRLTAGL